MKTKLRILFLLALLCLLPAYCAAQDEASKIEKLPTIQEAWVDAGFFTWTDSTKTALRITELGINQEILPDVSDGEQLTSAREMFTSWDVDTDEFLFESLLERAPLFNTSNITDFTNMFSYCINLTSVPLLDTSRGIYFAGMFCTCISLTSVPLFDTSNGINFTGMFRYCTSLTSVPDFNIQTDADVEDMFEDCTFYK